jgi:cytochrome P450
MTHVSDPLYGERIATIDFDPMAQFDGVAGDNRDPYPDLAHKRRESPAEIAHFEGFMGALDTAVFYTYDLVSQVLRDNERFSSTGIRELMGTVMGPYVLVGMDEPEHGRHRQLVSHAFRQRALARWEAELVRGVIDELIDEFAHRGRAELVRELTFEFPVQVIAEILGIPRSDHDRFHGWAVDIINCAARPTEGLASSAALREYLVGIVDERRREPGEDVISDLVTAELDGEALSDEEIFSFLRLLLPAGAETTYRASGNLLFGLLSNPDQLEAVRADRDSLPAAVEEAIRWETPLLITTRVAATDVDIAGIHIPAGMQVIAHTGSANHDETRWENAEVFDIKREPKPHIAFGVGPHMCLGMHLARMEMRVTVDALLDHFDDLELDPGDDDPHIHGQQFRSPTSLPVRFTPT